MKENNPVLSETWHVMETIDENGQYKKSKFRKIEQIAFYLRPLRKWYVPCMECQRELKKMMVKGTWILGNREYEPLIELNSTKDTIDDDSWNTIDEHKATPEELNRIGLGRSVIVE